MNNKEILVKHKDLRMRFELEEKSLYKYTYNENMKKKEKLLDNVEVFDVDVDSIGSIHIISINYNDELNYNVISEGNMTKKLLKKSYGLKNNIYSLRIVVIEQKINIVFACKNVYDANVADLIHINIQNNKSVIWTFGKVDFKNKERAFLLAVDRQKNINCVSQSDNDTIIRQFIFKEDKWGSINRINIFQKNSEIKALYLDDSEVLHTIVEGSEGVYYIGFKKDTNTGLYSKKEINKLNCPKQLQYLTIVINEYIYVVYTDNNEKFYSMRKLRQSKWSKFLKIEFYCEDIFYKNRELMTITKVENDNILVLGLDEDFFSKEIQRIESIIYKDETDNNVIEEGMERTEKMSKVKNIKKKGFFSKLFK